VPKLDAVVLNDIGEPGIGFDAGDNEVTVLTEREETRIPRASKDEVAGSILDIVLSDRSSTKVMVPR